MPTTEKTQERLQDLDDEESEHEEPENNNAEDGYSSDDGHEEQEVDVDNDGDSQDEKAKEEEEEDNENAIHDESEDDQNEEQSDDDEGDDQHRPKKPLKKVHKLSLEKTEDFNEKLRRRGVIYIARIPPRMTPTKIKALLSQFGEVTRVYLVEEDKSVRKRRRKMKGNGSKRYTEGWVEFASRKVAKHVAASLNTTPISTQKRNVHCGDLWNLKYLSKFKWSHLTEKVAYERRVREQKLRLETLQARKETSAYKQLVVTGKKLDKIEERRRKRAEKRGQDDTTTPSSLNPYKKQRKIKQLRPLHDGAEKSASKAVIGSLL